MTLKIAVMLRVAGLSMMIDRWEGEAPAEPQAICDARFGRSLALPKRHMPNKQEHHP